MEKDQNSAHSVTEMLLKS